MARLAVRVRVRFRVEATAEHGPTRPSFSFNISFNNRV